MATLANLRTRVRAITRDPDGMFIDDTDIDAWLNEAYKDIAARTETIEQEVTGTWGATAFLSLPPGAQEEVLRVLTLRLEDVDVEFVDHDTFWAYFDSGAEPAHSIGIVFEGVVQVYPQPDSGTAYVLRYRAMPNTLTSGDTVLLPTQFHRKMIQYAEAQVFYKQDEIQRGDRKLADYEEGLPPIALGMDKMTPGPFTIAFEPGPFDLDPEARHY